MTKMDFSKFSEYADEMAQRKHFELLDSLKIGHIITWRRLKSWENPSDVLTVKDRIDVEGPEWKKAIYKRLRAVMEGFNGRVKSRASYSS
ncbi:MAG TPA: hypothetical protein VM050_12915 [Patescibacteria group bacterium]|nr:hypothetical protein [Patescibacteria group bacterium]